MPDKSLRTSPARLQPRKQWVFSGYRQNKNPRDPEAAGAEISDQPGTYLAKTSLAV